MFKSKNVLNKNCILLLFIFFLVELFINPIGEFCLNDDWAYASSVKTLLKQGKFQVGSWPAMTLYAHVLWGFVFSKIFGFSFTILRVSILFLSFITLCITENFFFRLTKNKTYSFTISILFLFNPLFLSLSNSFMTDISFFSFFLMSIYFFHQFYSLKKMKFLIIGFGVSLIAIFIRQLGIILPLSFLLVSFFMSIYSKKWRKIMFISLLFSIFTFILLFLFEKHVFNTLNAQSSFQGLFYSKKTIEISFLKTLEHFYVRLGLMLLYSGLFLFPILIPRSHDIWLRFKSSTFISKTITCFFLSLIIFVFHYFPCGNYIYDCGIGLETTIDLMDLKQNLSHTYFIELFIIIKIISVAGNVLLIMELFSFCKPLNYLKGFLTQNQFLLFCIITLFLYQILITISFSFFDRYSICFFTLCLLIITLRNFDNNRLSSLTILTLIFYSIFSVFCIKDYFNYNKIKTKLTNDLETVNHILPENINGGFEYNMWQSYSTENDFKWENNYKTYVVSFSKIAGYSKIKQYSYQRYVPFKIDTIFVLNKNAK